MSHQATVTAGSEKGESIEFMPPFIHGFHMPAVSGPMTFPHCALAPPTRFLIRALLATLAAAVAPLLEGASGAGDAADELRGVATGFFHLERVRDRDYLITPEGQAFVALGLNHCSDETTGTPAGQQTVLDNLRAWGFNAGDYQPPEWMRDRIPHTHGITLAPIAAWMTPAQFGFRDVFDPIFLAELERTVRATCEPQRNNPLLIGYFFTDVPRWGRTPPKAADESLIVEPAVAVQNWISFFQTLPPGVPGRERWEKWRREHAGKPDEDFLPVIARQLYGQAHAFVRKYDPNHLIFGDRYHESDMPEPVVLEALPFIDALALQTVNPEFDPAFFDVLTARFGKPIYLCDHVSSFTTPEYPRTMGPVAATAIEYVRYYHRYVTAALSHPAIIGYNRCQYRSRIRVAGLPPLLKQGLLQLNGQPYKEVVAAVSAANQTALAAAYRRALPGSAKNATPAGK